MNCDKTMDMCWDIWYLKRTDQKSELDKHQNGMQVHYFVTILKPKVNTQLYAHMHEKHCASCLECHFTKKKKKKKKQACYFCVFWVTSIQSDYCIRVVYTEFIIVIKTVFVNICITFFIVDYSKFQLLTMVNWTLPKHYFKSNILSVNSVIKPPDHECVQKSSKSQIHCSHSKITWWFIDHKTCNRYYKQLSLSITINVIFQISTIFPLTLSTWMSSPQDKYFFIFSPLYFNLFPLIF